MKTLLITLGVAILLALGYYTLSPLFQNVTIDEALPSSVEESQAYPVMGTIAHPARGQVRILATPEGTIVRYEDFETINGPDLHVYLAKDLDGKEFIDLGAIQGTRGNINYAVPKGIDVGEYRYVMHWCVPFRVLFNYAEIQE